VAQEETLAATQPPVVLVVPGAPVAERSAPPAASPVAVAPDPQAVIRETLRRYEAAYESLDVGALLRVFPRFAQEANLRKSFAGLSKYEMDLRVTRIDVNGDDATAAATISRRMSPRVGAPQNNDDTTEFRLRRSGEEWLIVSATPR
jgi:hypothetical protein